MSAVMTENVFKGMAKRYDTPDRIELANIILDEAKKEFQETKDKSLLDYGSGTGLISLELAELVDFVTLVDSSEQMLKVADAKIAARNIENARVFYADFTKEVPDLKVDMIFVSLVLLHVPDTNKLLESFYQVLNEGGKLVIVDFDKNSKVDHPKIHNGFTHEEIEEHLTKVGFKSVEINTFYQGEKIFAKQDASMFMSTSVK